MVNDISILAAIPGLALAEPCCATEVAPLLDHLLTASKGSGYLRLVSIPCEIPYRLPADYRVRRGVGVELRPGKDAAIIGYGPVLLPQAWRAAELIEQRAGLGVAVINLPWLNQVDRDWLRRTLGHRAAVFTLDNHLIAGGQGRMIAAAIAGLALARPPAVRHLGLTDFPVCGQNDEVLRAHGLDADSLARDMHETLRAFEPAGAEAE